MATLPSATTTIDSEAGAIAVNTGLLVILAPVGTAADGVPRLFSSTKALLAQHGYAPGVDYAAMHFEEPNKPVMFVGLPIVTVGSVGQADQSGITGTSLITVSGTAVGNTTCLEEVDATLTVVDGGTVGTSQISFDLSLDGGDTTKRVRLGTATYYQIPYVGIRIAFAPGTLVAGDVFTFRTTAPKWDQAGLAAARTALAAQLKLARSWLLVGDMTAEDDAIDFLTEINGYETANDRFVYARAQVRDEDPVGKLAQIHVRMQGAPELTFAEVAATGDTITRSAGSWIADDFAIGDYVTVTGAVAGAGANNVTGVIADLDATVLTFDTTDLVNEGPIAGCAVVGSKPLVFAEVGATGDTITRTQGSWIADGFRVGQTVTIIGTASNNVTGAIATMTATVLTFGATDLVAEELGSYGVAITAAAQTDAAWVTAVDAEFADVDDEIRLDLGAGRGRKLSPITGWRFRRPVAWAASLREYQHDVHIPTWRKEDGACFGWDLENDEGTVVEHDERSDGGLLAARFTCFRTWANGPAGAFIALSLTRATADARLARTHNVAVANIACTVVQGRAENAIGRVLELNDDGTATEASLTLLENEINAALAVELLQDGKPEGARASSAKWTASRADLLNVAGATLNGTLDLVLNGTLEHIDTITRVR